MIQGLGLLGLRRCNSRDDVTMADTQELLHACPATGATSLLPPSQLSFCSVHLPRLASRPPPLTCYQQHQNHTFSSLHDAPRFLTHCSQQLVKIHLGYHGDVRPPLSPPSPQGLKGTDDWADVTFKCFR